MPCELCGSDEASYIVDVEGTRLNVCRRCVKFGRIIAQVKQISPPAKEKKEDIAEKEPEPEIIRIITPDFAKKIRASREKLGLNQEDFAKKITEKESVVHKLETGELVLPIKVAEKLERILGIRLIEEYKEEHPKTASEKTGEVTIGDIIKIKKRVK